jgi:hypothetical protein
MCPGDQSADQFQLRAVSKEKGAKVLSPADVTANCGMQMHAVRTHRRERA